MNRITATWIGALHLLRSYLPEPDTDREEGVTTTEYAVLAGIMVGVALALGALVKAFVERTGASLGGGFIH